MGALVHDPAAASAPRFAELPDPVPAADEALVTVTAASFGVLDVTVVEIP